jgi:hypothetical protein
MEALENLWDVTSPAVELQFGATARPADVPAAIIIAEWVLSLTSLKCAVER